MLEQVQGQLLGRRLDDLGKSKAEIIQVTSPNEGGPAAMALILVESRSAVRRGRYISWINYFDVEYAQRLEPEEWVLVEPSQSVKRRIDWHPFGWPDAERVPVIGDEQIRGSK